MDAAKNPYGNRAGNPGCVSFTSQGWMDLYWCSLIDFDHYAIAAYQDRQGHHTSDLRCQHCFTHVDNPRIEHVFICHLSPRGPK